MNVCCQNPSAPTQVAETCSSCISVECLYLEFPVIFDTGNDNRRMLVFSILPIGALHLHNNSIA